jgi:hypothetical protein
MPQLARSALSALHEPEQLVCPVGQLTTHIPPAHT